MPSRIACAILFSWIAPHCPAQQPSSALGIQPVILQAEYCRQADGRYVLRLQSSTELANKGPTPLLVPRIARRAAQSLVPEQGQAYRSEYELTMDDESPPSLYAAAAPSPEYFSTLRPGETIRRGGDTLVFSLAPISQERATRGLSPGPYSLRLTLNFGPHVQPKPGDAPNSAKKRWKPHGHLILGPVESRPTTITVEAPQETLCIGPPLIISR